jgi:5-methylcytosine-specific restriction endonuclease McrA
MKNTMSLPTIPADPEPTKKQCRRYLRDDLREPLRSLWAAFEWRHERRKTHPNEFLIPFAPNKECYEKNYLSSSLWHSIRERVLLEANYECACCTSKASEVHHRDYRPRVLDGNDISPLVAVCRKCHRQIDKAKGRESWNESERLLAAMVAAKSA